MFNKIFFYIFRVEAPLVFYKISRQFSRNCQSLDRSFMNSKNIGNFFGRYKFQIANINFHFGYPFTCIIAMIDSLVKWDNKDNL